MTRVLAILFRFSVILLGYVVASLAASLFLNVVSLGPIDWRPEEVAFVGMGALVFSVPFTALFVAYFAFVPAFAAIILAELLGKRDWLFYAIAGAVVGLIVVGLLRGVAETASEMVSDTRFALALAGGGIVGGWFYWLTAGRWAGSWRGAATSPERSES